MHFLQARCFRVFFSFFSVSRCFLAIYQTYGFPTRLCASTLSTLLGSVHRSMRLVNMVAGVAIPDSLELWVIFLVSYFLFTNHLLSNIASNVTLFNFVTRIEPRPADENKPPK